MLTDKHRITEIRARLDAASDRWDLTPWGEDKHYGTVIRIGAGNNTKIWKTEEDDYPFGDAAPSKRDNSSEHDRLGGHYESVRDLANADFIVNAKKDIEFLLYLIERDQK